MALGQYCLIDRHVNLAGLYRKKRGLGEMRSRGRGKSDGHGHGRGRGRGTNEEDVFETGQFSFLTYVIYI